MSGAEQVDIHPDSPTWQSIVAWAKAQIAKSQTELEARGTAAPDTEFVRGRIAVLRELISQADPKPAMVGSPDLY